MEPDEESASVSSEKGEKKAAAAPAPVPEDKMVTIKGLSDVTYKMLPEGVTTSALSLLFGQEIKKLTSNGSVTKAMKDGRFTGLVPGSIYHVAMKPLTRHQSKKHPNTPDDARLLFRKYDGDGNGSIDKEEWRQLARAVGMNMKDEDLDRMFFIVDTDANGTIEYDEFERWFCGDLGDGDGKIKRLVKGMGETLHAIPASDLDDVLEIFNAFDADHSGTVERSEFRDLSRQLGLRMSLEKTDEMFDAIDVDGNGSLDFQEFLAWYVASTQEASGGKTDLFLHNVKDKLRYFKGAKKEEEKKKEEKKEKKEEEKKEEEKKEEEKEEEKKEDEKKEESEEKTEEKKKDKKKKDKKKKGEEEKKEEEKKEEEKPAAAEEKEEEKKGLSAGWNAVPSLENGWTSVAEEPAEICVKDMLIRMRGCVNGSKGKIFTLPEGFAPAATERFPCVKKGEESKVVPVTVDQDGNVIAGATDGVLCLSTIVFFKK